MPESKMGKAPTRLHLPWKTVRVYVGKTVGKQPGSETEGGLQLRRAFFLLSLRLGRMGYGRDAAGGAGAGARSTRIPCQRGDSFSRFSSFLRSSISSRSRDSKRSAMGSGKLMWSMVASGRRSPSILITLAGTPITVELAGTDFKTTELAPIFTLSPTLMPPRIFAPAPTTTWLPRVGWRLPRSLP